MSTLVYKGITYTVLDSMSNKDFTGQDVSKGINLNNKVIHSSCFSQEKPDSTPFKNTLTGCTFIMCNLDNCFIPNGNTVIDCTQKRFKVQKDGEDWYVDALNNPISPVDIDGFIAEGISTDHTQIGNNSARRQAKRDARAAARDAAIEAFKAQWDATH